MAACTPPASQVGKQLAQEAVRSLRRHIHYRYGGTEPKRGLDCSAFIGYLYSRISVGAQLPRTVRQLHGMAVPVRLTQMKPGDLVFFKNGDGRVSHVGLYIGHGHFIHASRMHNAIREASLASRYWRERVESAGRVWS